MWNPSKLPTPAEWVTVRRLRVKDAVNTVWWLSKTPWPKASNRRVLQPYSASMEELLERGYKAKKRPSGHDISEKFSIDNGAAIPPNLVAIPNTESNSFYLRYCEERGLAPHPARFPAELPEYFIRVQTELLIFVVVAVAVVRAAGEMIGVELAINTVQHPHGVAVGPDATWFFIVRWRGECLCNVKDLCGQVVGVDREVTVHRPRP